MVRVCAWLRIWSPTSLRLLAVGSSLGNLLSCVDNDNGGGGPYADSPLSAENFGKSCSWLVISVAGLLVVPWALVAGFLLSMVANMVKMLTEGCSG